MNGSEHIVELVDISLSNKAGVSVFNGLSFYLSQGETALIAGSTGTGKTSLVELLIGGKKPDSGTILIFGKRLDFKKERMIRSIRRRIGGIGGIFSLISYQTVYENLNYPLILRGDSASHRKKKIMQILPKFGLLGKKWEKATNLSRGEKILVMLARATIADQPLLLTDEPLAGLDSIMTSKVVDLLNRLSLAGHSMIILTTQGAGLQLPDVSKYVIENGQLK